MRQLQPRREKSARADCDRQGLSLHQLAHELNSMLDGSMRCISLAQQVLDRGVAGAPADDAIHEAAARLATAQQSMQAMAAMLERAMRGDCPTHNDQRSIAEAVRAIVASCAAKAEQAGVRIDIHLAETVSMLRIGPLGPIVLNGLRNAIDACSENPSGPRRVEISIGLNVKGQLEMLIADTGPGVRRNSGGQQTTKADGHGIGLELCRNIAERLGGHVDLMNVPFGGGAILRVLIPAFKLGTI